MKRTLSTLLALLMLAASFTACSSDGGNTSDTTAAQGDSAETTTAAEAAETDRTQIKDTLPEADFEGGEFRILVGETFERYVMAHEMNGDVINDAFVKSTQTTEERFNVKLVPINFDATKLTYQNEVRTMVMAGDDVFDFGTIHDLSAAQLSIEGLFVNVYDIPHLDFDMPWWPKNVIDVMTFQDQMYIFANSLDLFSLGSTGAMFFNKEMIDNYGIEDPYTTVFDGTWTLDYFRSIIKDIYEDVNGNSERDDEDIYGYAKSGNFYGYLEAFNVETMHKNGDKLEVGANTDRMISLIEKHYDLFFNTTGARHIREVVEKENDNSTLFSKEKLMFSYSFIRDAVDIFRYSDFEYGIVPMPKYAEDEEYYAACNARPSFVPITNTDLEKTGIIIESMSAEGYKHNFPAYYEVALKDKFLSDPQSVEILDMIYSSTLLSFSYLYEKYPGYIQAFSTLFNCDNPNTDFTSYYKSKEDAAAARCAEIEEAFAEMGAK